MRVRIIRSPDSKKKFRAILEDNRTVDFGARGYSDYTKHKNPLRMRLYVQRHGGRIPVSILKEKNASKVHKQMLKIERSDKEDWSIRGIDTAGFWSRWYLWSYPNFQDVKRYMHSRFGITFTRT